MKKPNIIFILSDDHGSWATGAYGNNDVITPNIDRLATKGIRFDNFFCTSPVCSPARASIISGKIPSQHGVHDWLSGGNLKTDEYSDTKMDRKQYLNTIPSSLDQQDLRLNELPRIFEHPKYRGAVAKEGQSIEYLQNLAKYPQVLSDNGYRCGMVGKWHLGATTTKQAGFDYWQPIARGGTGYMFPEVIENGKVVIKDQYVSNYIADKAIDFLNGTQNDEPFYLALNFTAPHSPWRKQEHPKHIWELYDESKFSYVQPQPIHKFASPTAPYPNPDTSASTLLHGYYSAITAMDEQIGRVIDTVNSKTYADNTIIIYTSDNGMNLGQHGVWGKGNGTYPLNFYEESIKVPFIYFDPRLINNQRVATNMVSQYDIFPTILDISNIKYNFDTSFPGTSFKKILNGVNMCDNSVVIFDEYGPNRMIRNDRYKLVIRYTDGDNELYDLLTDPHEKVNLLTSDEHTSVYNQLRGQLHEWFEKYVDPRFNGRNANVTGFGQYDQIKDNNQPFEPILNKFKG